MAVPRHLHLLRIDDHGRMTETTRLMSPVEQGTKPVTGAPFSHGTAPISLVGLVGGTMAAALLFLSFNVMDVYSHKIDSIETLKRPSSLAKPVSGTFLRMDSLR